MKNRRIIYYLVIYYMAGKKRSGLANDRRAYGCGRYCGYIQSANVDPSPTPNPPTTTYMVTYNGNGFTGGSVPIDGSSPYTSGSTVTVLGNTGSLVKTGNTFSGWNTAADGSGISYSPGNAFAMPSSNVTLYAQWTPVVPSTYTVTYNGNGFTGGSVPIDGSSPYTSGSTVTVLGNSGSLAKTGNQFAGWNTAADGSGTNYVGGDIFTINANTILYANWIIVGSPRLVYNAGTGGSGTAPSSSGTYYTAFSTQPVVGNTGSFSNGSLVFGGWNTLANGTGTSYPAGSNVTMPGSGTTTLYAQWINPATTYTLTYNAGTGGSGTAPASPTLYSSNSTATILGNTGPYTNSDTTKIFYGWNTSADGSGTSYSTGSTITMNANKTLYAQWGSPPLLTVTYDANGATGGAVPAAPTTYPTAVQVSILGQGSLTRPGYTFLGWNGSSTGAGTLYAPGYTFASKTTTLYAQWAPGSPVKNCGGGSGSGTFSFIFPFAQAIKSTDTITIYTACIYGSTSTNYGSGLGPEGIISVSSKVVITSATITINTNTTYLNSANDYNYAYTITNGSGVTYWPSGATLSSVAFPTLSTTTNSLPVTYRLSNRNCTNGCGLLNTTGGGVYSPTISSLAFFNQGVTLNYSNVTNTIFVASPTNSFYSVLGSTTSPIVWTTTPTNFYPYALITPRSSAALTTITILPSTASEYIYPPMPDYTLQYDGNGATGGAIPPPRYFLPYNTTPSPAPNPAPPAPPNTLPYTVVGNTGSLTKSGFIFSRWNTAADGSGTNYGPGYTTTYSGGASITLYAIWV